MRDVESFSSPQAQSRGPILYIVRHGQTELNAENSFRGFKDVKLDETGRKQAIDAAKTIGPQNWSFAYSSDLARASETLDHILGGQKVPNTQRLASMRPWNIGAFAGLPKTQMNKSMLQSYADHPHSPIPDGESLHMFRHRYGNFFSAAVSHGVRGPGPGLLVQHASNNHEVGNILYGNIDSLDVDPGGVIAVYATTEGLKGQALSGQVRHAMDYS